MTENIKGILTLPNKIWGAIAIAGTVVLLSEPIGRNYSGGKSFYEHTSLWIFLISILAWSILVVSFIAWKWKKHKIKVVLKKVKTFLNGSSTDIKAVVKRFYDEPTHTLQCPMSDQRIILLQSKLVISKATSMIPIYDYDNIQCEYFLQQWVIDGIKDKSIVL